MYNGFINAKVRTKRLREAKKARQIAYSESRNNACRKQSLVRTENWTKNVDKKAAIVLYKGSTCLIHPSEHQFRNHKAEGNIYIRK